MAAASEPVRFVGSVDALEGLVPVPPARRRDIAVRISGSDGEPVETRVLTAPAGASWTTVRLLLPEDTPPGDYEATVELGTERYRAVVQVPARARVLMLPATVEVDVSPDEPVTVTVVVANTGNTAVEIPRTVAIGLFDVGGLDRAIGEGLSSDAKGVDRLGVVADTLAGSHGGLLRIVVRSEAEVVEPGTSATLTCEARPSGAIVEGRSYFGYWQIGDATSTVLLHVQRANGPRERATVTNLPSTASSATSRRAGTKETAGADDTSAEKSSRRTSTTTRRSSSRTRKDTT